MESTGKVEDQATEKVDTCKLCGGRGHWGRECPVRTLRQVASNDAGSTATSLALTSSGSASQAAASSQQSTKVRRIIQVNLNDLDEPMEEPLVRVVKASESYDMTYSDSDGEWCICEENGDGDTVYFTKFTDGIKDFAGEHGMDGGSSPPGLDKVNIRKVTVNEAKPIILDSGADMSVLPLEYMNVGFSLSKKSVLRDAHQGNIMPGGALREALVEKVGGAGNMVAIKETFAPSNVAEPLLALGKFLKKGWKVEGHDGEVNLSFGELSMAVQGRHNSLVTQATIRAVTSAGAVPVNVRTVAMTFDGMMRSMITVPGWHLSLDRRVPFLVVPNTKYFKDSYPQFNRNDFPFRSTATVVQKGSIWEVVEVAERRQDEA